MDQAKDKTISPPSAPVFARVADSQLLAYGVPGEWLDDVKEVSDEDALLALADHLPAEAAEARAVAWYRQHTGAPLPRCHR